MMETKISLRSAQSRKTVLFHPADYRVRRSILLFLLRTIGIPLMVKVDSIKGQENVPRSGPVILMINHIAFVDPFLLLPNLNRQITPMAKIEVYHYPLVGIFPRIYGVIPVHREEMDRQAIRKALEALNAGEIILIAPEGTRGPALKQGKEGVSYIASRTSSPIVPVAIKGTTGFPSLRGSPRWRKPGAVIRFGPAFKFQSAYTRADREQLRQMTDEAMYVLAGMLPPEQRGYYHDLGKATQKTIEFLDPD